MDGMPATGLPGLIHQRVKDFFYQKEVPYGLAMVRILLPLAMLLPMLQRLPWVRELYSTDGATVQLSAIYRFGNWLPEFSGSVVVGLYVLMLFCLISSSLGFMTRLSLCLATALFTYFCLLDAISTITKYSVIATDAMLVMCMANSGAIWSVDSWLAKRRVNFWPGEPVIERPRVAVWPARLIQLLIAFVYFGAGITKIQTEAFFSGDQMRFWMLTNVNFNNPVGESMALMPAVLIISAYVTVVWEMAFIFTVWGGWQRPVMLFIGVTFHALTCLMLGLYIFPLICISLYFAFLRESDVRILAAIYRRFRRRSGWRPSRPAELEAARGRRLPIPAALRLPAPVTFAVLAGSTVLLGIEAEYRQDIYGARSPDGPPALPELDRRTVQTMLSASEPLREEDKFFSFDVGTTSIGGILADSRREFTYGDVILAQGSLNPPHEDLLVECEVVDDQDRVIHHFQTFVTREKLRCDFYYRVGADTAPGRYAFVLRSSGKEVARRPFELVGTPPQNEIVLGN